MESVEDCSTTTTPTPRLRVWYPEYAEYLILIASSLLAKSVIHTAYYIECGGLCLMCTYYTVCLQFG